MVYLNNVFHWLNGKPALGHLALSVGERHFATSMAVGQEHDLEHDARVVGAGTHFVVVELGIQWREVE